MQIQNAGLQTQIAKQDRHSETNQQLLIALLNEQRKKYRFEHDICMLEGRFLELEDTLKKVKIEEPASEVILRQDKEIELLKNEIELLKRE